MGRNKVSAPQGAPVQVPASAAAPSASERYKLHSSYIWLGSLRIVAALIVVLIAGFADAFTSIMDIVRHERGILVLMAIGVLAIVLVVVFALAIGYQAWSYKHIYYEIGPDEFSFYKGIFTKKRMHVPYQRVQSVNQRASLLQRLVGVCTVKVDTAGGASNEGITIPYVTKAAAESLRRELFARKAAILSGAQTAAGTNASAPSAATSVSDAAPVGGNALDDVSETFEDVRGIFGGAEVETGRISYECRLTNKELFLSALTNSGSSAAVAIGLVASLVSIVGGLAGTFLNDAALFIGSLGTVALVVAGVVVSLLLGIFIWALSVGASLLAYGGFRVVRRDKRIEVEHGLLSRSFHGLDADRVQSVIIKQGFIRRLFGYCELSLGKIDSASQSSQNDQQAAQSRGLVIHPFVKVALVPQILAGLVPEYAGVPVQLQPVARVALRRAIVRNCTWNGFGFWLLGIALIVHLFLLLIDVALSPLVTGLFVAAYVIAVVFMALGAVSAVLWYRGSGFACNREFMCVANGGFSTKTVMFPRKKIQFGYLATNPFQRAAHVATLHAKSAAGLGTDVKLMDVAQTQADAWFAWLHPHGNQHM